MERRNETAIFASKIRRKARPAPPPRRVGRAERASSGHAPLKFYPRFRAREYKRALWALDVNQAVNRGSLGSQSGRLRGERAREFYQRREVGGKPPDEAGAPEVV